MQHNVKPEKKKQITMRFLMITHRVDILNTIQEALTEFKYPQ